MIWNVRSSGVRVFVERWKGSVLERKSGEERGFFVMDFRWITRRLNYWRALMHQWRTASGSNREDTVLQGGYSVSGRI